MKGSNGILNLAKEIKSRNNIKYIGAVNGTVLSISPLKIGIIDNQVILDESNCFICKSVLEQNMQKATVKTVGNPDYDADLVFKDILHVDDIVLVIASSDNQTFFIVDKLEVIT